MKRSALYILSLSIFSLFFSACTQIEELHSNSEGHYDVSDIDRDIMYALEGKWAYSPNQFVSPTFPIELYDRFELISDPWIHYEDPQPVMGYATYAARIRGIDTEKVYALYFSRTSSAFTVFINGHLFYNSGKPGTQFFEEIFDWNAQVVVLPLRNETEANIVIHISNFHDRKPGIERSFYIGTYKAVKEYQAVEKLITSGVFALLLSMGTFFISLFLFYQKEKEAGLFGIICLILALRTSCYNDFLIKDILPDFSGYLMFRLGYFTFPMTAVVMFLFIFKLFVHNTEKRIRILYILLAPLLIYAVLTLIAPFAFFTKTLTIVQAYTLLLALLACTLVVIAIKNKKPLAIPFLISFLLFIGAGIFDISISQGLVQAAFISHFAILFLLVPMAFIVLNHFSQAFTVMQALTDSIHNTNIAFKRFFPAEFMQFLHKTSVTDIKLGDHTNKNMFIAFIRLDITTELSTHEAREELFIVYNTVTQFANGMIQKHHGFIDKYLTEGIMVLFYGTAEEAVNCIIDITALINTINMKRKENNQSLINTATGIHYGQVMMGTIGEQERMDTTVISDSVNISSRLHSYAAQKNAHILISEAVRRQLSENYWRTHSCFYHGKIQFSGKKTLMHIYEVARL